MTDNIKEINLAVATIFKSLCVGEYSGDMSSKPNNPQLFQFFSDLGYWQNWSSEDKSRDKSFASILERIAMELKK